MALHTQDSTTMSPENESPPPPNLVPKMTGGWPLVGHLLEFVNNPVAMLDRGWCEQGEIVRFRLGTRNVVLFAGPEAHDFYFRAPEDELNAKAVYQFTVPIFGRGVAYDVAPELMAEQLGFLFPALRDASMRRFACLMDEEIKMFADSMGESGEIDLPHAMNELTVKIASRCLLGDEVRAQVDTGFAEAYHDLQNGINTLGFFVPHFPTKGHKRRVRARKQVAELFGEIMAQRRNSGHRPEDFMQTLMEARYKNGRPMSDHEVTGILLTVLFAGQHTSAVLATWTGLELLKTPQYLMQVRAEIEDVYHKRVTMSVESLKQQGFLEHAVRENERMHPPLILLVRKVLKPLLYKGHTIPSGTLAMVSPAVSHRLPHLFSNPDRFNPNRFAEPAREDKQHRYTLIGFGGGKHMCMGKHFAYMQLKAIWTVLLDRFEFELATPFPAPNYRSWVTGPEAPCRLQYRMRSSSPELS